MRIRSQIPAFCSSWLPYAALLFSLLLLAACSRSAPPPTQAAPAAAPSSGTALPATPVVVTPTPTVVEAAPAESADPPQVLRVAVNLEFRPFVFKDESGSLAGFDIELINALSAAGNFEIAFVETPFEGIFDRLDVGEYDAVISALTVTDERLEQVDFTDIYFESGQALVSYLGAGQGLAVRTGNTAIQGVESLTETVRVGVKSETTGDTFATNQTSAEIVRFAEADEAVAALVAGELDAVILDIAVLARATQGEIMLVGPPVTQEYYAIAVAKSRPEVRDLLNEALATIRADGTYDQLVQRWFGAP